MKNIVVGISSLQYQSVLYKSLEMMSNNGYELDVLLSSKIYSQVDIKFLEKVSLGVFYDMFSPPSQWSMSHLSLSDRADLFWLPFSSPEILGKMSLGIADDLLSSTLLAAGNTPITCCYSESEATTNSTWLNHRDRLKDRGVVFQGLKEEECCEEILVKTVSGEW